MNSEAVEWLESLDELARTEFFTPIPTFGEFASLKLDHERCMFCRPGAMVAAE